MIPAIELTSEEERKDTFKIEVETLVAEHYGYREQLAQMAVDVREITDHPTYYLPFLEPGRLVKVKWEKLDFGCGVVLTFQKRLPPKVWCTHALSK